MRGRLMPDGVDPTEAHPSLVSVVIPTYNRTELLGQTLRSVCAQTHAELEIIVCDDGGTEDVAGLVSRLSDKRVRYLRSEVNTGKAGIFAAGLRQARGKYVMELDDDDLLAPHCIATLVAPLEADDDLAVAFGDHWIIDVRGRVDEAASKANSTFWSRDSLRPGKHTPFIDLALIFQAVCMNVCGIARRSSLDVEDFPPDVRGMSDYWLGYLACRDGGAAWYVAERLSYYRQHELSITGTRNDEGFRSRSYVFATLLEESRVTDAWPHLTRQLHDNELSYAAWLLRMGRRVEARARARRARTTLGSRDRALRAVELLSWFPALGPWLMRRVRRSPTVPRPS
jgi:glycosyltransferase involved in cell wall biosynthesis